MVIADHDAEGASSLARDVGATAAPVDMTDPQAIAQVVSDHGPFQIAVNNVGQDQHAFFTQTTPDDWHRLIAVNLEAAFALTHAVLPAMQKAGYGRIVTIGSEAGRMGSRGGSVYAAAKGGLIAFTKSIARENARFEITANLVSPGPIRTPMLEAAVEKVGETLREAMEGSTLLGRLGEPDEVASAVAFLASREAAFITGETLGVSGGMALG